MVFMFFLVFLVSCPFLEKDEIWESGEGGGEGMRAPLRTSVRSPSSFGILHLYALAAAAPPPIAWEAKGEGRREKVKEEDGPLFLLLYPGKAG